VPGDTDEDDMVAGLSLKVPPLKATRWDARDATVKLKKLEVGAKNQDKSFKARDFISS
jgi:hypothetical protein